MSEIAYFELWRPNFERATSEMGKAFRILEKQVAPAVLTRLHGHAVPRYKEQTSHQAAVQKTARYLSGVNALLLLLSRGYFQEQGVLQRTLDEIGEDIFFLLMPVQNDDEAALRARYLNAFFQEEFDEGVAPIDSTKRRDQIKRYKIRNFIERRVGDPTGTSTKASSVLAQTYSGYVHAASPHIMDMWSMESFRFEVTGITDPSLIHSHVNDAWNYVYRGFLNLEALARALGNAELTLALKNEADAFGRTEPL